MSYRPHQRLVEPARASSGLGRLAAGIAAIMSIFMVLSLVINSLQDALIPFAQKRQWAEALQTGSTPMAALVNLYFFLALILALGGSLWMFHNRTVSSLIGPISPAISQFLRVIKAMVPIYLVAILLPAPDTMISSPNLPLPYWLALLPVTLLGLLIQCSAEELIFRGYLQSQLAARFRHPLVWIGLPSTVFALLHFDPYIDGTSAWLITSWALVFGLATADLTARSGTLGPAIALHLVNNTSAIAIAAPEGNFDGLALYTFPFSLSDSELVIAWMPVEMLILACSWLAARIALRC